MARDTSKDWQVFISCKVSNGKRGGYTRDWRLAKKLYDLLEAQSIRAFLRDFSIDEIGEAAYKKHIEDALNKARVMVVVASSKENLNSKCVKHEWKGFHNYIVKGIKRNGQIFTFVENIRKSEMSR